MKHVAIIPARAGSKSIPNKNLQKLRGKSLVSYAIDAAKGAGFFHDILITTDIPLLFDEYQNDRSLKVISRPEELCTDTALMADVLHHALSYVGYSGFAWLLQPTTPFRQQKHFKDIRNTLETHSPKPRSLISFKDVGANHPKRCYHLVRGEAFRVSGANFQNKQDLAPNYIRNGAFYCTDIDTFKETKDFEKRPRLPYLMDEVSSINIDGPFDLLIAQAAVEHKWIT